MEAARGMVRTASLNDRTVTLVCGPSEKRVRLLFTPAADTATYYTISTEPNLTLGEGLNVLSSSPIEISSQAHGDAVVRSWYAISSAPMKIGFLETVIT